MERHLARRQEVDGFRNWMGVGGEDLEGAQGRDVYLRNACVLGTTLSCFVLCVLVLALSSLCLISYSCLVSSERTRRDRVSL